MKIFFQDNCIPSRISVLLLSFHYKAWIFGAAYYWLIWLLLLSVLVGSLYSGKYSLLIGWNKTKIISWYKAILISDWLIQSYTDLWLVVCLQCTTWEPPLDHWETSLSWLTLMMKKCFSNMMMFPPPTPLIKQTKIQRLFHVIYRSAYDDGYILTVTILF